MAVNVESRFRAADIWDTPDDGYRYEVVDGELYVNPAPNVAHQHVCGALFLALASHVRAHRLGLVLPAPTTVVLEPETGVQPDLLFLSEARRGLLSEQGVEGAPDLVVEVLSPRTVALDRGVKMLRYARAGIPHYWLVDPRRLALEAYELRGGVYELADALGSGDVFCPTLFPGLDIHLSELFLLR